MSSATLLLPARRRFAGQSLPVALARALGRATTSADAGSVQSIFDVVPRGWPAAAVTRQSDAGDAGGATWLRADPAHVRPDINGARLLGLGESLQLGAGDAEAFLSLLRPLFGDAGMPIDAPVPSRWYLRLAPGSPLPDFIPPDEALGADLLGQLPAGDAGRRWRALMSEAQILLHNHPLNAERAARGAAAVNSLWFWGGGRLPTTVRASVASVVTPDQTVRAFASMAGVQALELPDRWEPPAADLVVDLRHARRFDLLCERWLQPALADVDAGRVAALRLDWSDGLRHEVRRSQAWRFWRRPLDLLMPEAD